MAHEYFTLGTKGYKHTVGICNTHCFSTKTMVARTRLDVTLYVHFLSLPYLMRPTERLQMHNTLPSIRQVPSLNHYEETWCDDFINLWASVPTEKWWSKTTLPTTHHAHATVENVMTMFIHAVGRVATVRLTWVRIWLLPSVPPKLRHPQFV